MLEAITATQENERMLLEIIADLERQLTEAKQPQPDWSLAPEWANFWAVDENGAQFWYATKPIVGSDQWLSSGQLKQVTHWPTVDSWQYTLRERPTS
jgi:hypothetical protein